MTTHSDEPEPGGPIDRELTRRHEAFTAKVEAALDVEAGLRDILFQSRHEAFTAKAETALNVEAGLRDILTPPTVQATPSLSPAVAPPVVKAATGGSRWQASPAQRLKLRSNPRVAAANRVLHLVGNWVSTSPRAGNRTHDIVRALDRDLSRSFPRDVARDLARDLACACDRALDHDLDHDLDHGLDRARALARALVLARDLTLDLTLARDLDLAHFRDRNPYRAPVRDFDRDRDRDRALDPNRVFVLDSALDYVLGLDSARADDLDRALDVDRVLAIARNLDLAMDLARTRDLELYHERGRARARAGGRNAALDRACDLARDLARALALAVDRELDSVQCRCLEIINNEYTQAIGAPVAADKESLASLMDDFTTDDLSDADVREDDIKLTGVRWSDGTTWPASADIDRLKRRSDRQKDGSWIIRTGTGNVRNNVLT